MVSVLCGATSTKCVPLYFDNAHHRHFLCDYKYMLKFRPHKKNKILFGKLHLGNYIIYLLPQIHKQ
jgi:hypothetical protein